MLDLQEAIEILECGDWVSIRFITADILKGTGGKVIELAKCRIARRRMNEPPAERLSTTSTFSKPRNPNHHYHFTRNVELQSKKLIKIHPILITHINQRAVV